MTWLPGIKGTIQVKDQRSLDLLKFEMTEKIKFQKQQNHEDRKLGPLSDQWYDFALLFHILVSMALLPGSLPHSLSHNVVFVFRFDRRDSTPCHDLQTILF